MTFFLQRKQTYLVYSLIGLLILSGTITISMYYLKKKSNESPIQTSNENTNDNNSLIPVTYNFTSFSDFLHAYNTETNTTEKARIISIFLKQEANKGFPVTNMTHATFIYLGQSNSKTVYVAGDFNGWNPSVTDQLQVLEGSTLYYKTYEFEFDARLDYKFIVDGQWILDPLNNRTVMGGYGPNSELAMPGYVQSPELGYYNIPHGVIIKHANVFAPMLSNTRDIYVYLPPDYNESKKYPSVYFNDGTEYLDYANASNILDYLIYKGLIQPVIGVFVPPVNRNDEYGSNPNYASFINNVVVTLIDSTYSTNTSSHARSIIGVSLGGLISTYIAFNSPDIWGHVGSFSGAFWYTPDIIDDIRNSQPVDITWYLDYGSYEPESISSYNNDLISILQANGYEYTFYLWHEGHSWGSWRAHLDLALMLFYPQ